MEREEITMFRINWLGRAVCAALVCVLLVSSASADMFQWTVAEGGNGHYYEFVYDSISWYAAKTNAEGMSHMGVSGHLVTITSSEENEWVWNHQIIGGDDRFRAAGNWIGAYQEGASATAKDAVQGFAPDERWAWVTGEEWEFTNWYSGYPNDGGFYNPAQDVDFAQFVCPVPGTSQWRDVRQSGGICQVARGYMVEYDIPEPATLTLLGIGGLLALRRRKRG